MAHSRTIRQAECRQFARPARPATPVAHTASSTRGAKYMAIKNIEGVIRNNSKKGCRQLIVESVTAGVGANASRSTETLVTKSRRIPHIGRLVMYTGKPGAHVRVKFEAAKNVKPCGDSFIITFQSRQAAIIHMDHRHRILTDSLINTDPASIQTAEGSFKAG